MLGNVWILLGEFTCLSLLEGYMVNKSFTLLCLVLDKLTSQFRNFRIFDKLFNAILSQKKKYNRNIWPGSFKAEFR